MRALPLYVGDLPDHPDRYTELRLEIAGVSERRREGLLTATLHDDGQVSSAPESRFVVPVESWEADSVSSPLVVNQARGSRSDSGDPALDLGSRLFAAAVSGPVVSLYAAALEQASRRRSRSGLCLRICHDGPTTAALPWELLYDNDLGQEFLGLGPRTSVIRCAWGTADRDVAPIAGRARLLVLANDPSGVLQAEWDVEAVGSLTEHADLDVTTERNLGSSALLDRVAQGGYDILHVVSQMVPGAVGELLLGTVGPDTGPDTGPPEPVRASDLVEALRRARPSVLVLNTCRSDGLAAELAAAVPVVVGIRGDISPANCVLFVRGFYSALLSGAPVPAAAAAGRTQIAFRAPGDPAWAAPVVYSWTIREVIAPRGPAAGAAGEPQAPGAGSPDQLDDAGSASVHRRLEMSRKNLKAISERWDPVTEPRPQIVERQRAEAEAALAADALALESVSAPTSTTPVAPPAQPGDVLQRTRVIAALAQRYQAGRASLLRLERLIEDLDASRLVVVVGERALASHAARWLSQAELAMARLAEPSPDDPDRAIADLETVLGAEPWRLLEEAADSLDSLRAEAATEVANYREQLRVWRVRVNNRRKAVDAARLAGAVVVDHARVACELDGLLKPAEKDAESLRFDTVAVTLHRLHKAFDARSTAAEGNSQTALAAMDEADARFAAELLTEERKARMLGTRAELLVMRGPKGQGSIEYSIILRVPATDLQEVHMQASSVVVVQDRDAFRDIVADVTEQINQGIRSVRGAVSAEGAAAGDTPVPARQPGAAAEPALEPEPAADHSTAAGPRRVMRSELPSAPAPHTDVEGALRGIGSLMYSLLVPDTMQRQISDMHCSLTVATDDLELPWELLHDGEEFLSLARPMTRMPLGRSFPRRRRVSPAGERGTSVRALFIASDPRGDLPGATAEVEHVTSALRTRWGSSVSFTILTGDDATGRRLNDELRSGGYQLVHYAGHAQFDKHNPERSALLLRDDELYFAQKVQRLMEGRPLVFLNACETSAVANERDDPATTYVAEETQGLASAFIYGGAAACVGSLWPVYDDTASALAVSFYHSLFQGNRVGEALRMARRQVRSEHADRVTWASYALYGDPTFVLPLLPVAVTPAPQPV